MGGHFGRRLIAGTSTAAYTACSGSLGRREALRDPTEEDVWQTNKNRPRCRRKGAGLTRRSPQSSEHGGVALHGMHHESEAPVPDDIAAVEQLVSETIDGPLSDACAALGTLLGLNPDDASLTRH